MEFMRDRDSPPLRRLNLLVLGHGRAGKTTLLKAVEQGGKGLQELPATESTIGIDQSPVSFDSRQVSGVSSAYFDSVLFLPPPSPPPAFVHLRSWPRTPALPSLYLSLRTGTRSNRVHCVGFRRTARVLVDSYLLHLAQTHACVAAGRFIAGAQLAEKASAVLGRLADSADAGSAVTKRREQLRVSRDVGRDQGRCCRFTCAQAICFRALS